MIGADLFTLPVTESMDFVEVCAPSLPLKLTA